MVPAPLLPEAMVAQAVERFGQLDVMVCNAGFGIYGEIDRITPDQMQRQMDVNYMGTYHAVRAALPMYSQTGEMPADEPATLQKVLAVSLEKVKSAPFDAPATYTNQWVTQ